MDSKHLNELYCLLDSQTKKIWKQYCNTKILLEENTGKLREIELYLIKEWLSNRQYMSDERFNRDRDYFYGVEGAINAILNSFFVEYEDDDAEDEIEE